MQIAINKTIRPHFAEKMIANVMTITNQPAYERISQKEDSVAKRKTKYGVSYSDFSSPSEYQRATRNVEAYRESKEKREFIEDQLQGTIFGAENQEGEIL